MNENEKKPIYKRVWFIVLCVVVVFAIIGAIVGDDSTTDQVATQETSSQEADTKADTETTQVAEVTESTEKETTKAEPNKTESAVISPKDVEWSTELYINENGNVQKAVNVLSKMSQDDYNAHSAINADMATVIKKPWDYYGEFISLNGYVVVSQAYPAGSDVSKSLGFNGTVTELVITNEDETSNTSFFYFGDATDIADFSYVTVTGLPCGLQEVPNKVGGNFTHLVVVGTAKPQVIN